MSKMSKLQKHFKWERIRNNYVLRIDGERYVSYNPNTGSDHLGSLLDSFIGESGEETALVDRTNPEHEHRILQGDWRNDYEKLAVKGFEDCVDFFLEKRREHGGLWSTHKKDRRSNNDLRTIT